MNPDRGLVRFIHVEPVRNTIDDVATFWHESEAGGNVRRSHFGEAQMRYVEIHSNLRIHFSPEVP